MDEPTAALSGVEVERLFAVAHSLRDEGRAAMFISHRFDEVFDLCDTITVMRDGTYISTDQPRTPASRTKSYGGWQPRRHVDEAVRRKAIDHHLECIEIMNQTGSGPEDLARRRHQLCRAG